MSFQHTCFVSYSHGNKQIVQEFIKQLQDALDSQLETYFKKAQFGKSDHDNFYFIDHDRITTGAIVDTTVADALFDSVCMLVAFWPAYENSDYCLRELEGMKQIEAMRKTHCNYPDDTECLIIPVYFKYCGEKPRLFNTEGLDVSKFFLATGNLSQLNEFWVEIDKVCIKIVEHFKGLTQNKSKLVSLFKERQSFALPPVVPKKNSPPKRQRLMSRSGK